MARPSSMLDASHQVVTPEYVEFNFVVSGLFSRFLAWLIDRLLIIVVSTGAFMLLLTVMAVAPGLGTGLFILITFVVDWGYGILFETWWSGQTPGKRALGLRVIQESGVRIDFFRAVLRNLARAFDSFPVLYLVGGTFALFSRAHQRLGDLLAGTIVVRERRLRIPSGIARAEEETQLLGDPLFQARIAKLSSEEEETIFAAAIRREELAMEARLKLFAELSTHLQEHVGLYKPPHLSDEKLVLLAAAALAARAQQKAQLERGRKHPVRVRTTRRP